MPDNNTFDLSKSYNWNFNNYFKQFVPFFIERKFCYPEFSDKDTTNQISKISSYQLIDVNNPPQTINQQDNQALNYLFLDKFKDVSQSFVDQTRDYLSTINTNSSNETSNDLNRKLSSLQKNTINNLNEKNIYLNNEKHRNIKTYNRKDYIKNKYNFYYNLVVDTVFVFAIIFTLELLSRKSNLIPEKIGLYLNIAIITIYMLYLLIKLNKSSDRNKEDWSKFNFRNIKVEDTE